MKKLLFGIGNPGAEYEGTRHNIGRAFTVYAHGHESNMFVNQSGVAVKKLKAQHKLKNEDIIIVHDDLDIEFGKVKFSFDKSSAGHKGVQSVIDALKTQKFWRLRIGTASPRLRGARHSKDKQKAIADFVLSKFTPAEKKQLPKIFEKAFHELQNRLHYA